ncbi:jerky-like protein [Trichonephila clavipes]|nr:jerky-like protein [Trichonephila clavipes]
MKRKTTREANDVLLDRALYLWFSQRRSKEDLISVHLLCEKAPELDEKLAVESESLSGDKNSAHKFKKTFLQSGGEGYSRDDDNNVDEIGVNWKALPRKSLSSNVIQQHQALKSARNMLQLWFVRTLMINKEIMMSSNPPNILPSTAGIDHHNICK